MIKLIYTAACILIGTVAIGQTYNSIDPKVKSTIDSTYNALIKKNKVIGTSIAIVKDGEIIYATGYGYQNQADSIKADENSIYRIGSCTKSFTALSVMQLQEDDKLDVAHAIQDYVKAIQIKSRFSEKNQILIKDILTHTSGLPSDIFNGFFCDAPPSIDWLITQLNKCTMAAPAKYQHSYSNTGYSLLGKLVETVSNQDYESYIKANIFTPLGMTSSYIKPVTNLNKYASKGYMGSKAIDEAIIRDHAAGLIHSNVIDMSHYINMYLANGNYNGNQIIKAGSITAMEKDGVNDIVLQTGKQWGYGLYADSIAIVSDQDSTLGRIIGHGGDTWAFHADFQYIPALNIGAVVLTNTNTGVRMSSAKNLLKLYLKESENITLKTIKKAKRKDGPQETICRPDEIIGLYNLGGLSVKVDNPKKIKFKQNGTNIILKPINDSLRYNGKVKLFGIIPIKIKHQSFRFVEYDGKVYMKLISTSSGNESFISTKTNLKPIPETWQKQLGNYTLSGDYFPCTDCPHMNFEGITMTLAIEAEQLVIKMKAKTADTKRTLPLNIISNEVAVTDGLGRNTGETVRILANGNVFYSGFEFKKAP